jgi:hypothetical protein
VRVRGAPKTDLLAPAGRRFANFVFAIFRFGALSGVGGAAGAAAAGRALDDQTDPLAAAPAFSRLGANADDDAASRPLSYGVSPKQAALKDQAFRPSVNLCGAESSRVRVRGAPKTDLLAPAGRRFANFVFAIFRFGALSGVGGAAGAAAAGRALDDQTDPLAAAPAFSRLGANADDDAASRPLSYGVSPKQAALKDQAFTAALTLLAPNPRACA